MTTSSLPHNSINVDVDTTDGDSGSAKRGNALSNKLTNILSFSYADTEIRDALRLLDGRFGATDVDGDFDLKYEAQREVIEANGRIIDDFSRVAKVPAFRPK